jgi:hypothetical protein
MFLLKNQTWLEIFYKFQTIRFTKGKRKGKLSSQQLISILFLPKQSQDLLSLGYTGWFFKAYVKISFDLALTVPKFFT